MLPLFPVDGVTAAPPAHPHRRADRRRRRACRPRRCRCSALAQTTSMPPGGRFWYSNVGYQALGILLESAGRRAVRGDLPAADPRAAADGDSEPDIRNDDAAADRGRPRAAARRPALASRRSAGARRVARVRRGGRQRLLRPPATSRRTLRMLLNRRRRACSTRAVVRLMTRPHVDSGDGDDYGYALDVRRPTGDDRPQRRDGRLPRARCGSTSTWLWARSPSRTAAAASDSWRSSRRAAGRRTRPSPTWPSSPTPPTRRRSTPSRAAEWRGPLRPLPLARPLDAGAARWARAAASRSSSQDGEELPLTPAEDGCLPRRQGGVEPRAAPLRPRAGRPRPARPAQPLALRQAVHRLSVRPRPTSPYVPSDSPTWRHGVSCARRPRQPRHTNRLGRCRTSSMVVHLRHGQWPATLRSNRNPPTGGGRRHLGGLAEQRGLHRPPARPAPPRRRPRGAGRARAPRPRRR